MADRLDKIKAEAFCKFVAKEVGAECVPEYKFHETRKWRFDFAVVSARLAIEIEGGVWTGGRHTSPTGFLGDMEKYNEASVRGWRLLRFTPQEMFKRKTFETIRRALEWQTIV
jgi:very-short-patch-repair endonuclease